jgi:hypothetical protein
MVEKTMSKIEAAVVGLCLGLLAPGLLFFASWWSSVFVLPERAIPAAALTGLAVGLLLDVFFLGHWVRRVYRLPAGLLVLAYLFLSLIVFAVSMGVPVLNTGLGVAGGAYVGRKLRHARVDRERLFAGARRVSLFTTLVLALICALSATIALISPSTPSDLQGLLRHLLPWRLTVTRSTVVGLILVGGFALVVLEYWLTMAAALAAYRHGPCESPIPNP